MFLSDSRTNAGVDQISTFRKMTVFEHPGERLIVLLTAGNLAITQAVRQIVCERTGPHDDSVWNAKNDVRGGARGRRGGARGAHRATARR